MDACQWWRKLVNKVEIKDKEKIWAVKQDAFSYQQQQKQQKKTLPNKKKWHDGIMETEGKLVLVYWREGKWPEGYKRWLQTSWLNR